MLEDPKGSLKCPDHLVEGSDQRVDKNEPPSGPRSRVQSAYRLAQHRIKAGNTAISTDSYDADKFRAAKKKGLEEARQAAAVARFKSGDASAEDSDGEPEQRPPPSVISGFETPAIHLTGIDSSSDPSAPTHWNGSEDILRPALPSKPRPGKMKRSAKSVFLQPGEKLQLTDDSEDWDED